MVVIATTCSGMNITRTGRMVMMIINHRARVLTKASLGRRNEVKTR